MSGKPARGSDRERWLRLIPLLDTALELEGDELAAWLDRLRAEDGALADDLVSLLARHGTLQREGFLDGPAEARPAASSLAGLVIGA